MSRKQVGSIGVELLDRVDVQARSLGQTRRVFIERALEGVLVEAERDAALKVLGTPGVAAEAFKALEKESLPRNLQTGRVSPSAPDAPVGTPAPVSNLGPGVRAHSPTCGCAVCK